MDSIRYNIKMTPNDANPSKDDPPVYHHTLDRMGLATYKYNIAKMTGCQLHARMHYIEI